MSPPLDSASRRSQARFEIKPSKDGGWYWHLLATNGEIVAVGETHTRPEDAQRAAEGVIGLIRGEPAPAIERAEA